ncbi:MAG: hypothetical protein J6C06_02850 [Lachnospiraceae bacterium]|nr:hypothetical protein [Lachnospiraceae bacterium]
MLTVSEVIKTVDTDEEIFERVEMCLNDFKNNFCRLGFMLRVLKERGYDNAYLMDRFGLSKSTINRSIQINEQFSENGYSYKLDEKYSDFKKSQLIEMLPLSQEQREEVSADMSVADIRDLKNDDVEEDPVEEVEERDVLPEFNPNNDSATTYKWIFDTLAAMPEVGSDISIQEDFLKSKKCKNILINKEMDLYISSEQGYYIRFTSSKYFISSWWYGYISSYMKSEYVLNNSTGEYIEPFDTWKLRMKLSKYFINQISDFDTLDHDDLFGWMIEKCKPGFNLDDEIFVSVGVNAFECKKKTRHCSVKFDCVESYFESDRLDLMNAFASYVIEESIDRYEFLFHLGDYDVYMGIGFHDFKYLILCDTENSQLGNKYLIYDEDSAEPFFVSEVLLDDFFAEYDMCVYRVWISNLDKTYCHREILFKKFLECCKSIEN